MIFNSKIWLFSLFSILLGIFPFSENKAQDSLNTKKSFHDIIKINGYLKNMQSMSFVNLDAISMDNLIHNRLNIKAYISPNLSASVGLRNRIIFGNQVAGSPNYGENIGRDNNLIDLSWTWIDKNAFVANSTIDRLNLNYIKDNLEVTVGRQRINWGLALAWNPNDLFNTYNYTDFDYEERPGTDAIRIQYYLKNGMSSFDVAVNQNADKQSTLAGKFKFNTHGYDLQILAGKYLDDFASGLGWAGSLWQLGFKGEMTYFIPLKKESLEKNAFVGTATLDYSFSNSIYLNGAYLFNSTGLNKPINLEGINTNLLSSFGNLTAKTLFPSQSAAFLTASYPINPLWNVSLAGMYGFGMNLAFLSPNISYSIREDLEAILVGQTYYMEQNEKMKLLGNGFYFRLKWSF